MNIIPNDSSHPIARLLRNTWGALAVIGAALVVGFGAAVWFVGLPASETVDALESEVERQKWENRLLADSLTSTAGRLVWVICNSVPQNRPDVLSALHVSCEYDTPARRTIRGVPILERDEE